MRGNPDRERAAAPLDRSADFGPFDGRTWLDSAALGPFGFRTRTRLAGRVPRGGRRCRTELTGARTRNFDLFRRWLRLRTKQARIDANLGRRLRRHRRHGYEVSRRWREIDQAKLAVCASNLFFGGRLVGK